MVSGSISLLYSRFFSPFPHGTCSLSVSREYLALRDGPRRFMQNFSCFALLRIALCFRFDSSTGLSPSTVDCSKSFYFKSSCNIVVLQPQTCLNKFGLGCSAFARHYLRNHFCFLLLWVLRCFSSPRSPTITGMTSLQLAGLPHSEINGSIDICSSPLLIAAYHVLLRLREPRHPPCALAYFRLLLTQTYQIIYSIIHAKGSIYTSYFRYSLQFL